MRCADQLHAALGDRTRSQGLELAPDLVDDDDFRVVVLDSLDHDLVLEHRLAHLHAARLTYSGMRDIAVAADLVGGIHDDHALRLGQDAGRFAQQGGLAHAGASEDENGLARFDDIFDDIDRTVNSPAHTQG
jgi:hypothetical protein